MMLLKKLAKKGILSLIIAAMMWSSMASAQGSILLPNVPTPDKGPSKIALVNQLPHGSWQQIIGTVINLLLAISGSLAFISFTVGGVIMISAQGVEDKIRKGKSILMWSLMALVIIGASFGIVLGITQLKFFQ